MKIKRNLWIVLGALLVCCGILLLGYSHVRVYLNNRHTADLLAKVQQTIPPKSHGSMAVYSEEQMPALSVDGQDVVALLSFPEKGVTLPVGGSYDAPRCKVYPHRYTGSVYDGSLVIGGQNQKGQFDCLTSLEWGDDVTVTDMTGTEFSFSVSGIRRVSSEKELNGAMGDLTLFTKESRDGRWYVVDCTAK